MKKKVGFFWAKIPCDEALKVGSCYYSDACSLSPFKNSSCPKIFKDQGVPCKCPITQVTDTVQIIIDFYSIKLYYRAIIKSMT